MAYAAVAIGGFIGACLRFFISEWMGSANGFPLPTLLINLLGSFFLSWFFTLTLERIRIHPHIRLGIGTGLVGAFTTFSTFTVEVWKLIENGLWTFVAIYIAASFIGGIGLALIGFRLAHGKDLPSMVEIEEEA